MPKLLDAIDCSLVVAERPGRDLRIVIGHAAYAMLSDELRAVGGTPIIRTERDPKGDWLLGRRLIIDRSEPAWRIEVADA